MAVKLSTGLASRLVSRKGRAKNLMTGTTISFAEGGGTDGRDRILDSGSGFVTAGFRAGDFIVVAGSVSNNFTAEILSVAAGVIEVAPGTTTTEAATPQIILASSDNGGSFLEIFDGGYAAIHASPRPSTADATEAGTLLAIITLASGVHNAATGENGLRFNPTLTNVLQKLAGQVWSGLGLSAGTAVWGRLYPKGSGVTGASTTVPRLDFSVGTSGADMIMGTTSVQVGATQTVDTFNLTLPMG